MLMSDALYTHSCAEAVGGWGTWLMVSDWTRDDWIVFVTTWPFVLSRLTIMLGFGLKGRSESERTVKAS